jgi:AraC-like DNA-binding protein
MDSVHRKPALPLVRLSLLLPFVEELDRRGLETNAVLKASGLVRDALFDHDVFVPPIVVHRFLEDAARAAGDPYLCARVGETLDDATWPPLVDAVSRARTLGDFVIRFIRAAKDEATSAKHVLEVGQRLAFFREKRTSEQEIAPAQNDAFTAAYVLRLIRRAAGPTWNAQDVRLTVCDPAALPDRYMGTQVNRGDRMGMTVSFPSAWLLQPFDARGFVESSSGRPVRGDPPIEFLESLRRTLQPHLQAPNLDVAFVVRLVGMSRQSLQRKLRAKGTTLSAEIGELKKRRAIEELVQSDRSIGEIATSIGFQNPTSFARAFKAWTGESPREYRRNRRVRLPDPSESRPGTPGRS